MKKIINYKHGEKLDGRVGHYVGSAIITSKGKVYGGDYTVTVEVKRTKTNDKQRSK